MTATLEQPFRERALAGDDAAFEALIAPLVEPGLRLAFSMLGDRSEAEDATQEAIAQAWRKLRQLRPEMPLRPWFMAIVANRCRSVRRTRWFRTVRAAEVLPREEPAQPAAEHLDIERGLARLPSADRQALFMYFYLDLPIEEVAIALGVSPAAARSRVYRACHRLRPHLVEEEA
jgi:RNA polymerase sigma-70 factor (ECF subfamily)